VLVKPNKWKQKDVGQRDAFCPTYYSSSCNRQIIMQQAPAEISSGAFFDKGF
jgi:hypothetical protein